MDLPQHPEFLFELQDDFMDRENSPGGSADLHLIFRQEI